MREWEEFFNSPNYILNTNVIYHFGFEANKFRFLTKENIIHNNTNNLRDIYKFCLKKKIKYTETQ